MTAVEICPFCDIAGCRHIRERKAKMTHPTDEELDALENRLKEPWNQRQSRRVAEEFDAADAITSLRTQLAEAKAEKERLGRELNLARYGQPDFSWQVHKEAIAEANTRADRAEAALAAHEWQPIGTAPKGGARIMLWRGATSCGKWSEMVIAEWLETAWCWPDSRENPSTHGEWTEDELIDGYADSKSFTHWRPLPVPPDHPKPHDRTALDRMLAEHEVRLREAREISESEKIAIRNKALRKLAKTIRGWRNDVPMTGDECANTILAMIEKKVT